MAWYLNINNGANQLFGDLNCSKLKRAIRSQAVGTFSFTETAPQMDSPALAGNLDTCKVLWIPPAGGDAVIYFRGRLSSIPRVGAPAGEERRYVISDAWMDFERITYQQQWNVIASVDEEGVPTTAIQYRSECILGMDLEGNALTSDAVIADVVNWAIARGAYVQLGTILAGGGGSAPVPFKEITDLPCSAVLQELLKLTPDAVTWFDYSTTPPTFNVTRRGACFAASVPFAGVPEDIDLTPRQDLVRGEVVIRYLQENTTDGSPSVNIIVDAAPGGADGLAYDSLVATVRLAGASATYQKQPVTTAPIPQSGSDDNIAGWFQAHVPWLAQFSTDRLQVSADTFSSYVTPDPGPNSPPNTDATVGDYPNELISGALPNWLITDKGLFTGIVNVSATISYLYPDSDDDESNVAYQYFGPDDGHLDGWNDKIYFSVNVRGTNATSQTYAQLSSYDQPEPAPVGFAAVLQGALSLLHYEGAYTAVNPEVDPANTLGIVLNITGSQQPWSTMNALVQEITDDLDEGRTTWKVGPPGHLTVQDLMEQLRYTRTRSPSSHIKERQTGRPGDAPEVDGPIAGPHSDSSSPTTTSGYPFIDFIDILDDDDGNPETWSALIGYGKDDSIAGPDAIDHTGPLESFELSVGNDGSSWLDSSGDSISDQATLQNLLSIISGEQQQTNDQILIGVGGETPGSVGIYPDGATIHFSPNMNPDSDTDSTPTLDLSYNQFQMEDGEGKSMVITAGSLVMSDTAGDSITFSEGDINIADAAGDEIDISSSEGISGSIGGGDFSLTCSTLTLNSGASEAEAQLTCDGLYCISEENGTIDISPTEAVGRNGDGSIGWSVSPLGIAVYGTAYPGIEMDVTALPGTATFINVTIDGSNYTLLGCHIT